MKLKTIAKGILLIPSVLVLVVLRILRPLIRVEVIVVAPNRFGHMALEPENFLSRRLAEQNETSSGRRFPKVFQLWSFGPRRLQYNRFIVRKWKEVLLAPPSWCVDSLIRAGEKFPALRLESPESSIFLSGNAFDHSRPHLSFSKGEIEDGRTELAKLGINTAKPMVCLIVREGGYHTLRGEAEHPVYEYRNFDISSFHLTAKSLVSRGYQVVRMGTGVEKPFGMELEGVFDYALSPYRSEFLDIYIAANCRFAVSTLTGLDCVCLVFRRPVCYIDVAVYNGFLFGTKLAHWSPAELQRDGKRLTLKEIVSSDVMWIKKPDDILRHGIRWVRSTPQGIEHLVSGFVDLYEGDFKRSPSDHVLSCRAQEIMETGMGERGAKTFGQINAQFNPVFLREHGDWFLALD